MCYQYKSHPRHNLRDTPKIPQPWKSSFIFQYFFLAGARSRQFVSVFRKQIHWFGRWRMRNNIAKCPCPFPLPLEEPSCTLPWAASWGLWHARMGMTSASQHRGLLELCFTSSIQRDAEEALFGQNTTLPQTVGSNPNHEWGNHLGRGCGAGTHGVQDLPDAVQSIRIVLIPLTQPPSGPAAGPARVSPRDGWPWELISCCARQMNYFGRKYQRSLHVVRHKGCWILKSCFQHPLQGCCFRAAMAFGMSPVLQCTGGVLFSPSSPTFGSTSAGNECKAAEICGICVGNYGLVVCVGVCATDVSLIAVQSLWKSFPGSVDPMMCSSKTPVGPGRWDLGFFRSVLLRKGCCHGDVQRTNLLTSRWLPSLLLPPFLLSLEHWPLGLCFVVQRAQACLPFGEHILLWWVPLGVFPAASSAVPRRSACGGWGIGWHMSRHVPAALGGMAHECASKWATLPSGWPAGSK